MLKLGFKEDVEKIMAAIKEKASKGLQILLFSATMPSWVRSMAQEFMSPSFQLIDLA